MNKIARRVAVLTASALAPLAFVTIVSPATSSAQCAWGHYWDPGINNCVGVPAAPPPPPPGPVNMCVGAPVPFVPMSWCFPVGG